MSAAVAGFERYPNRAVRHNCLFIRAGIRFLHAEFTGAWTAWIDV